MSSLHYWTGSRDSALSSSIQLWSGVLAVVSAVVDSLQWITVVTCRVIGLVTDRFVVVGVVL